MKYLFALFFVGHSVCSMSYDQASNHLESADDLVGKHTLTVHLSNLDCSKGAIMLAVFANAESFPEGTPLYSRRMPCAELKGEKIELHLPKGRLAIAVYHDLNDNKELDRNFFFFPTEPYGFSNNAQGRTGPPSFEQAAFMLSEDTSIDILLR